MAKHNYNESFKRYACKIRVLQHYGKGKQLCCRGRRCKITNPDLLTIDHINGISRVDRQASGRRRAGSSMHKWLETRGYPEGYQTLCYNCQAQKELLIRRRK